MGMKLNIKEASNVVGLTETALRTGIKQGKYSYLRVGRGRGHILLDVDILEAEIKEEAKQNKEKQAQLYEQYKKERCPEIYFKGSILG